MLAFKIETNTQCNKLKRLDLKLLFKDANAFHITAVNVLKTMVMEFEREREIQCSWTSQDTIFIRGLKVAKHDYPIFRIVCSIKSC